MLQNSQSSIMESATATEEAGGGRGVEDKEVGDGDRDGQDDEGDDFDDCDVDDDYYDGSEDVGNVATC